MHVIVWADSRPVEVQVRTLLQDLWAQMSDKMADRFGLDVKYGGGPEQVKQYLTNRADLIAEFEVLQYRVAQLRFGRAEPDKDAELVVLETDVRNVHSNLVNSLREGIVVLEG